MTPGRVAVAVVLVVAVAVAVAACTVGAPGADTPGPALDRWGNWAVWSPDDRVDTAELPGEQWWTRHRVAANRIHERGERPGPDVLDGLRSSLLLQIFVGPGEPVVATRIDVFATCDGWHHHERLDLDPPRPIGDDGSIAGEGGVVRWEATLTGSDRIRGTWSAGSCSGSWDGDGAGGAGGDGPGDGDWTRFFAEEPLGEPWYRIDAWDAELTTLGRHPELDHDLCVTVAIDVDEETGAGTVASIPDVPDLGRWLTASFQPAVSEPGRVVVDCDDPDRADLVVEARATTAVGAPSLSGPELRYRIDLRITGTVELRHPDHPTLRAPFAGAAGTVIRPVDGDGPADPEGWWRRALACGLSPVFETWWGIDESGLEPIVHPFVDPPVCASSG